MGRGEVCFQIIREVETCNFLIIGGGKVSRSTKGSFRFIYRA